MPSETPENTDAIASGNADEMLQVFVGFANRFGMNFGVLLSAKGAIISGTVISAEQYYNEVGGLLAESFTAGSAEATIAIRQAISETFSSKATISSATALNTKHELGELPPPMYIHLKNAAIFAGTTLSGGHDPLYWRGLLSSVDGWAFGSPNS